jgi:hypothetical protein
LREIRRVLRCDGRLALAFTTFSGQGKEGIAERLGDVSLSDCGLAETANAFCFLAPALTPPMMVSANYGERIPVAVRRRKR